jgi:hypothetical protein
LRADFNVRPQKDIEFLYRRYRKKLFLKKRYTDFLPVVLPTEDKVAEMLKASSHQPTEVLGKMNPGSEAGEAWTYTVKDAAVSAVMAGAEPEYFPVILALGSTGMTAVNVSDNGFMAGAVINGKIRDEIGLNYEEGAVGPMHRPTRPLEEPGACCPSMVETAAKSEQPTWARSATP